MVLFLAEILADMKVNFSTDKGYIFLFCSPRPYDQCKFYTNFKINSLLSTKDRVSRTGSNNFEMINEFLDELEKETKAFVFGRKVKRIGTSSLELWNHLNHFVNGKNEKESNNYTYSEFINYWVTLKNVEKSTSRAYLAALRRVFKVYPNLNWSDITMKWRIESESQFKKKYKLNSINIIYKRMRECLNDANDLGIYKIDIQQNKNWLSKTEEVDNIFLTRTEIETMYSFNYTDLKLRNAVDLFVLGCDSGQRYSDFSRLSKSMIIHVQNEAMIRMATQKSSGKMIFVSIPLTQRIDEILNRYKKISAAKLNEYIKVAAKIAGIDKWSQISTHTARRSFATNNVIDGIPNHITMSIGGWKTEKQLLKYVKYTDAMTALDFIKTQKKQNF